jgi:hypothetical protein
MFELAVRLLGANSSPLGDSLRRYFWYGESYEGKLRALVRTPNLPPQSLLFGGWISTEQLRDKPADVDVTLYGSSFAANLAASMIDLRPALRTRFVGAPGAPLNHLYGSYEIDRALRKTKTAVIGIVAENVGQVLTMNIGSLHSDAAMPFFFPRYDILNGRIVKTGESLVNSPVELARFLDDADLWRKQLEVLAVHDDAYRRYLFAADFLDASAIARIARRGLAKRHADSYLGRIHTRAGYNRETHAVKVFRALLVRMITDIRDERVTPLVVLFATNGFEDHLHSLLADLLAEQQVPYVNTFDTCPSTNRASFVADGHFTRECDLQTARKTLDLLDGVRRSN